MPKILCHLTILIFLLLRSISVADASDWSFTLYQGVVSGDSLGDVSTVSANFDGNSNYTALALARDMNHDGKNLKWEWEGQIVQHYGQQDYTEFNGLIKARWMKFPWDKILDTNFAIGEGLSIATRVPEIEKTNHDNASNILNYLLFEFEFPFHKYPNCSLVARIHHRSGVFGLFDGVSGASNAFGLGLRYTFK